MKTLAHNHALHLDFLRKQKRISIGDFCDEVISDRSYRRYISGERQLKQDSLYKFCKKLGITPENFYQSYRSQSNQERKLAFDLYNYLRQKDFDKFRILLTDLEKKELINDKNKQFIDYCYICFEFENKQITHQHAVDKLSTLISYNDIKERIIYDFVEIMTIHQIATIQVDFKMYDALDLMKKILFDSKLIYTSAELIHILPNLYAGVARMNGMKGDLETTRRISQLGIDYSLKHFNNQALANLYYTSALSNYKLGNEKKAMNHAVKCLFTSLSRGRINEYKRFKQVMEKDFGNDMLEQINKYLLEK